MKNEAEPKSGSMLDEAIINVVLSSEKITAFFDQRAEMKFQALKTEQKLTYEDIAAEWQLCLATVKNLTPGQLELMGLRKIKGGAWVRFQRIANIEASRDLFRQIKKGQNHP